VAARLNADKADDVVAKGRMDGTPAARGKHAQRVHKAGGGGGVAVRVGGPGEGSGEGGARDELAGGRQHAQRLEQDEGGVGGSVAAGMGAPGEGGGEDDEGDDLAVDEEHAQVPEVPVSRGCKGRWSKWRGCSAKCGGGNTNRTFTVTHLEQAGGRACENEDGHVESKECNSHECQDCKGQWSSWRSCSAQCGGGNTNREFTVTHPKYAGGDACEAGDGHLEWKACNRQDCLATQAVDCSGIWSSWSRCSKTCGGGDTHRTFTVMQARDTHARGEACEAGDGHVDSIDCNPQACPEAAHPVSDDCKGMWSSWSKCSAKCDGGTRQERANRYLFSSTASCFVPDASPPIVFCP